MSDSGNDLGPAQDSGSVQDIPMWKPSGWPPAWNPFQVFMLGLSVISSIGLIHGNAGSTVLDERLDDGVVIMWGICLAVGSVIALAGIYCYRTPRFLMLGLYLERTGLVMVGGAATIYAGVILTYASDVNGVRFSSSITIAYAAACFFRAWQDHKAITRTFRILRRSTRRSLDAGAPDGR